MDKLTEDKPLPWQLTINAGVYINKWLKDIKHTTTYIASSILYCLQIIVGQRRKVTTTDSPLSLSPVILSDTVVAVYLEKYSNEIPQIGKVWKIDVNIGWYLDVMLIN